MGLRLSLPVRAVRQQEKWRRDIAIILTIAIVATTMVMMVMVVLPITLIMVVMLLTATMAIDRSIDESTKIDRSVDEPSNEDRSINRCHLNPPPTSLSPAGRSYRYGV